MKVSLLRGSFVIPAEMEQLTILLQYITNLRTSFRENNNALWWQNYNEYLKTSKWNSIRLQVLKRDKFICQGCLNAKAVQVHHQNYNNLFDELLFQLISLCVDCHKKLHPDKDMNND